tara:strand:+ start:712 stop:891 length:180 start_codon:yes stop_codon:yes gene_type:complete
MAKVRKGYDAQDRVIAQFKRDVKRAFGGAVESCKKNKKEVKKQDDIVFSPLALIELYNG